MSPIRKERAHLYGKDWREFSDSIRFDRAQSRCECRGQCGTRHHGGIREGRCGSMHSTTVEYHADGKPTRRVKIVLTVAHLCHDESCRKRRHVKAMCQRCHLRYDAHHHAQNASATRDAKRGQQRLEFGLRASPTGAGDA